MLKIYLETLVIFAKRNLALMSIYQSKLKLKCIPYFHFILINFGEFAPYIQF